MTLLPKKGLWQRSQRRIVGYDGLAGDAPPIGCCAWMSPAPSRIFQIEQGQEQGRKKLFHKIFFLASPAYPSTSSSSPNSFALYPWCISLHLSASSLCRVVICFICTSDIHNAGLPSFQSRKYTMKMTTMTMPRCTSSLWDSHHYAPWWSRHPMLLAVSRISVDNCILTA